MVKWAKSPLAKKGYKYYKYYREIPSLLTGDGISSILKVWEN